MRQYLPFLLLLGGCTSQDPTTGTTTVSGQVVVYQTSQGVAQAQVQVYHASSGGGYVPVGQPYRFHFIQLRRTAVIPRYEAV